MTNPAGLEKAARDYAETIAPWAAQKAREMLGGVNKNNKDLWNQQAKAAGRELRQELADSQTGRVMESLVREQVGLIKSIPVQAAERAQTLAIEAATGGKRAEEVAAEIARTGEVTQSRAMLIARTETARANAALNEARALSVGSEGYIWRTAEDGDVRESHAEMDGVYVLYTSPPTLSDGMTGHAGTFPNCRCYQEPTLPARDY